MSELNVYLEENLIQYQDPFFGFISEHPGEALSVTVKVKLANGKTVRHHISGKMQLLLSRNMSDAEFYVKGKFKSATRNRETRAKARGESPSPDNDNVWFS